jgi:hypothetical protein
MVNSPSPSLILLEKQSPRSIPGISCQKNRPRRAIGELPDELSALKIIEGYEV